MGVIEPLLHLGQGKIALGLFFLAMHVLPLNFGMKLSSHLYSFLKKKFMKIAFRVISVLMSAETNIFDNDSGKIALIVFLKQYVWKHFP